MYAVQKNECNTRSSECNNNKIQRYQCVLLRSLKYGEAIFASLEQIKVTQLLWRSNNRTIL